MANIKGGFNSLFKQAHRMRNQITKMQDDLSEREVEASTGGDRVAIVILGNRQVKSLKISPEVIDPENIDMLEDLLVAAFNRAMENVEEMYQSEMTKITGGFSIPGMF